MYSGKVKFFDKSRGYGFIAGTGNTKGKEFFVHVTDLNNEIVAGDRVEFEIGEGKKGPAAKNVTMI